MADDLTVDQMDEKFQNLDEIQTLRLMMEVSTESLKQMIHERLNPQNPPPTVVDLLTDPINKDLLDLWIRVVNLRANVRTAIRA